MLLRMTGAWRAMKFVSLGHYSAERLGMAERTLEQRIWLARRCYFLPGLREALREGRLGYEAARAVAGIATERTIDAWIERAAKLTVVELRREIQGAEETQMCARWELTIRMPRRIAELLVLVIRAARAACPGRNLRQGDCLAIASAHFITTWGPSVTAKETPHRRVIARDGGCCQVPGCSRAAVHAHHIDFRSHGGSDAPENLVSACLVHHLRCLHQGRLRVTGTAPLALAWELGRGRGRFEPRAR